MAKLNTAVIHDMLEGKGRDRRVIGNNTVAERLTDNTVSDTRYGVAVSLHGHAIATIWGDSMLLTLAGWGTVTTRDRLNTICREFAPGAGFFQRKGDQFFRRASGKTLQIGEHDLVHVTR